MELQQASDSSNMHLTFVTMDGVRVALSCNDDGSANK